MTPKKFKDIVWKYYREHGRHELPWRKTTDAYRILVSEVMLQQTQVERVIPYYARFLKKFPTVRALAASPLSQVLIEWQGLGYNRRAKMLHEAAKAVVGLHNGTFPASAAELEELPGIGPYTAGAITAFAHNQDGLFIETNIRTAITHHFFNTESDNRNQSTIIYDSALFKIDDREIMKVLEKVFPKGQAREWYAALMDYGTYLKRSGVRINAKAKGYAKQSTFKGSAREARGAILRALVTGPKKASELVQLLGTDRKEQLNAQITALTNDGLVRRSRAGVVLAD